MHLCSSYKFARNIAEVLLGERFLGRKHKRLIHKSIWSMESTTTSDEQTDVHKAYEKAVQTLNIVQLQPRTYTDQKGYFELAKKFAELGKLTDAKLNKLKAVHVSGTKGKGSVCAFCESIFRHSGLKTGFYSSPHLMEVRERIRINGRPISKQLFTQYFWEFWNNFDKCDIGLPTYKMFMTFMAFHVFLKEKVDVAVVEVGLGGEYDATNILRNPSVCGVTLLEKDHLQSLGGTAESIAWHKAGIFKPAVPAFTVPQNAVSLKVLSERAAERKTSLMVVPSISAFQADKLPVLGIEGKHQFHNASLAVYLCRTWFKNNKPEKLLNNPTQSTPSPSQMFVSTADVFDMPESFKEGLCKTYWPARSHCIQRDNLTIYIDGAHTSKSVEACASWFCDKTNGEKLTKKLGRVAKVLIFNCKGNKDAKSLLEPLVKCNFDYVVFCPNLLSVEPVVGHSDVIHLNEDPDCERQRCYEIQNIWKQLLNNYSLLPNTSETPDIQTRIENSRVFASVAEAVQWSVNGWDMSVPSGAQPLPDVLLRVEHVQLLVTGSLYLSGLVMTVLGTNIVEL